MKICDFPFLLFLRKNEKTPKNLDFTRLFGFVFGIPDRNRTDGLLLRRQSLYPTELRRHILQENEIQFVLSLYLQHFNYNYILPDCQPSKQKTSAILRLRMNLSITAQLGKQKPFFCPCPFFRI